MRMNMTKHTGSSIPLLMSLSLILKEVLTWAKDVAVVECLPSIHDALSSIPSILHTVVVKIGKAYMDHI